MTPPALKITNSVLAQPGEAIDRSCVPNDMLYTMHSTI